MDWWQALLLGLVEGLTEYLPVSSTGHLLLAQRALGLESGEAANAFAICIQSGAVVAVCAIYFRRLQRMAAGLVGADREGLRLALALLIAFAPAAVAGVLFDERIERALFGLWPVVAAWLVGGLAILAFGRRVRDDERKLEIEALSLRAAFLIGLCQCLALWPGTSRSLATIAGGLLVGLRLRAAVEFSFLLGLITLTAATGYKALDSGAAMLESYGPAALALGFGAALVSAWASVRWMVSYLERRGLEVFGYWRVGLAVLTAALLLTGALSAG